MSQCQTQVELLLDRPTSFIMADPVYEVEDTDCAGYWTRPVAQKYDARRKLLRKEVFASIVTVLTQMVRYHSRIIVGYEQGGLVAACLSMPLVVETACRTRIVTAREMSTFRRAWSRLCGLFVFNPLITATKFSMEFF